MLQNGGERFPIPIKPPVNPKEPVLLLPAVADTPNSLAADQVLQAAEKPKPLEEDVGPSPNVLVYFDDVRTSRHIPDAVFSTLIGKTETDRHAQFDSADQAEKAFKQIRKGWRRLSPKPKSEYSLSSPISRAEVLRLHRFGLLLSDYFKVFSQSGEVPEAVNAVVEAANEWRKMPDEDWKSVQKAFHKLSKTEKFEQAFDPKNLHFKLLKSKQIRGNLSRKVKDIHHAVKGVREQLAEIEAYKAKRFREGDEHLFDPAQDRTQLHPEVKVKEFNEVRRAVRIFLNVLYPLVTQEYAHDQFPTANSAIFQTLFGILENFTKLQLKLESSRKSDFLSAEEVNTYNACLEQFAAIEKRLKQIFGLEE